MIKIEKVSKSYSEGLAALEDVNLTIEDGEFVFIVGESGSGKSTLIKLLLREIKPTEGNITVNGNIINKLKRRDIPKYRREIGCVFQDFLFKPLVDDVEEGDAAVFVHLADDACGQLFAASDCVNPHLVAFADVD